MEEFQRKCEPPNKIIAVSLIKPNTSRKKTTLLSLSLCTGNGFFQRIFHGNFSPKHRKDFVHTRWVGYKSVWFGFFSKTILWIPLQKGVATSPEFSWRKMIHDRCSTDLSWFFLGLCGQSPVNLLRPFFNGTFYLHNDILLVPSNQIDKVRSIEIDESIHLQFQANQWPTSRFPC